jgi:FkbM family methyltransferase
VKSIFRLVAKLSSRSIRFRTLALKANTLASKLQGTKRINFYNHQLIAPSRHPLQKIHTAPFRDLALAIASNVVFKKNRNHYVDVGANIGDTAAVIEASANQGFNVHGTLVEPSEFFLRYLERNAPQLNNPDIIKCFAATKYPAEDITGIFHHWTGNAEVVPVTSSIIALADNQVNVAELITPSTAILKVDCEGQDVEILSAMILHGLKFYPVIYFECSIQDEFSLAKLSDLYSNLQAHYESVIISDPDGRPIYTGEFNRSTLDVSVYQYQSNRIKAGYLPYLDIMLFPRGSDDFLVVQQKMRSAFFTPDSF